MARVLAPSPPAQILTRLQAFLPRPQKIGPARRKSLTPLHCRRAGSCARLEGRNSERSPCAGQEVRPCEIHGNGPSTRAGWPGQSQILPNAPPTLRAKPVRKTHRWVRVARGKELLRPYLAAIHHDRDSNTRVRARKGS